MCYAKCYANVFFAWAKCAIFLCYRICYLYCYNNTYATHGGVAMCPRGGCKAS